MRFSILAASLAALQLATPGAAATTTNALQRRDDTSASQYWFSTIERQGVATFADDAGYQVFRNVRDYGAKGDGITDDTEAINAAVGTGPGRCIQECDSRTTHPAIVYFPSGTYLVSAPIVQTYYTQFVGDALHMPTLKGSVGFYGPGIIDADPYVPNSPPDHPNWYINQNNFFRQIRNLIIDMTEMPTLNASSGIHWQVAQATSLQNIVINMNPAKSVNNQRGLFIENGSGGFMADLVINGGGIGADIGSQQFTTRNITFNNCNTAISMIWDWLWLMQGVTINGGQLGINMTSDDYNQIKVGSLLLLDSKISNVPVGISTLYKPNNGYTNNTLILDNVDMSENVPVAVQYAIDGTTLLDGNKHISGWIQGRDYNSGTGQAVQMAQDRIKKPAVLLASDGKVFTRTKPQYETVAAQSFVSVKSAGVVGDGETDDTAAIQKVFDNVGDGDIVYFDHGAYVISDTVHIPKNIKITGEMWPLLMATGEKFADAGNPAVVFEVGQPGDVGDVEISDLIIETKGPLPGAILMEWNLAGTEQGAAGMWDVHFRVGGTAGTELQSDHCSKTPNTTTTVVDDKCMGSFLMLHLTETASAYVENCWFWVADHELDLEDHNQLNIYNGRGVLIESQGPVWLWGTASEHSVLYNYQISNAKNTFIGLAQTETAYMQGNPDATQGVTVLESYHDPDFSVSCRGSSDNCARTWGMRVTNSSDIFVLGTGMYSFFDNYGQECLDTQSCQENMISIENSGVNMYGISTKAAVNMLTVDGKPIAQDKDNRNTFCAAIARYESSNSANAGYDGGSSTNSSSSLPVSTVSSTASTLSSTLISSSVSTSSTASISASPVMSSSASTSSTASTASSTLISTSMSTSSAASTSSPMVTSSSVSTPTTSSAYYFSSTTGGVSGPGSSSSSAGSSLSLIFATQTASPTSIYSQNVGDVTTVTLFSPSPTQTPEDTTCSDDGGSQEPVSTLTSLASMSTQSSGSSGTNAGNTGIAPMTVTVTETVTAAGSCQTA